MTVNNESGKRFKLIRNNNSSLVVIYFFCDDNPLWPVPNDAVYRFVKRTKKHPNRKHTIRKKNPKPMAVKDLKS